VRVKRGRQARNLREQLGENESTGNRHIQAKVQPAPGRCLPMLVLTV